MQNILLVKIVNSNRGLKEKNKGLFLRDFFLFLEVVKKGAFFGVFQNQIDILGVLKIMVKFDDVRVLDPFLEFYLAFYLFHGSKLDDKLFRDLGKILEKVFKGKLPLSWRKVVRFLCL